MCHGTPWSAAVWAPVAQALSRDYRVFLWDMPGYGQSIADEPQDADLVSQRRRLVALLRHWGLDRPHVVAHDIGGAVALGAHLLEGEDFRSLYLADIVTLDPWGSEFFSLVAQHEAVFAAVPLRLHRALVREYIAGAAGPDLTVDVVDELALPWCTPAGQEAFYRQIGQLDAAHTRPIAERLGEVRCPVRVGWGERDPWIPVEQAWQLAAALPGDVETRVFPDAGHLLPLEAADAVAVDVRAWFDGMVGA